MLFDSQKLSGLPDALSQDIHAQRLDERDRENLGIDSLFRQLLRSLDCERCCDSVCGDGDVLSLSEEDGVCAAEISRLGKVGHGVAVQSDVDGSLLCECVLKCKLGLS